MWKLIESMRVPYAPLKELSLTCSLGMISELAQQRGLPVPEFAKELWDARIPGALLRAMECSAVELRQAGLTPQDLWQCGFTIHQLQLAGVVGIFRGSMKGASDCSMYLSTIMGLGSSIFIRYGDVTPQGVATDDSPASPASLGSTGH